MDYLAETKQWVQLLLTLWCMRYTRDINYLQETLELDWRAKFMIEVPLFLNNSAN